MCGLNLSIERLYLLIKSYMCTCRGCAFITLLKKNIFHSLLSLSRIPCCYFKGSSFKCRRYSQATIT